MRCFAACRTLVYSRPAICMDARYVSRSIETHALLSSPSRAGEAAQVRPVLQVLPDAGRPQVAHVRAQRLVAVQVPRLLARLQQAHEPQEPPVPAHR